MKTLNRTLSLVLVLVMVLGLFGVASAKYNDDAEIQYKEAVGVLTGIGAIDGMGDGNFAPKGNLTRAQAAKLVAYTILGKDVAKILPVKASSFKDVGADLVWAIPSIEYLVSRGIISGLGDGTFNPNGNVTSNQFAKMLLVALGIKGEFTGESWELNTAIAANKAGIFKGAVTADRTKPATREEAALYCFNALVYTPTTNETKTVTKYLVSATNKDPAPTYPASFVGETFDTIAAVKTAGGALVLGVDYTITPVTVTESVLTGSIADDVYSLGKSVATDAFGRPAVRTWTYKGKTISSEGTVAPAVTYTKTVKTGTIYSDLKRNSGTTGDKVIGTAVYTNGVPGTATTDDVTIALNGTATVGGNGVVTEVYTNDAGVPTTIVKILPTMGKITDVSTGKDLNGSTYTKYTIGSGVNYATTKEVKIYSAALNNEKDEAVFTGTIAKGDYVTFYTVASTTYVSPVTLVTGKLTSYSSATGMYTIEGKTYALSAATGNKAPVSADYNKTSVFAVDSYGYLLGSVTINTADDYLYVIKVDKSYVLNGTTLEESIVASVILPDGTAAKSAVAKVDTTAVSTTGAVPLGMYTYKVNAKGAYELTTKTQATNATLSPKDPLVASGIYANNLTKFVIVNWTKDGTTDVVAGTANVITGYTNLSGMSSVVGSYIDADGNNVAEVVFIYSKAVAGSAVNYVYYLGTYSTNGTTTSYDFVVNGVKTTIDDVTGAVTAPGLVSIDASNVATAVDFDAEVALKIATDSTAKDGIYKAKALSFDNGLVKVGGTVTAPAAASVPVYIFDGASFEVTTLGELSGTVTGNFVIAQNGTAITAISLVK